MSIARRGIRPLGRQLDLTGLVASELGQQPVGTDDFALARWRIGGLLVVLPRTAGVV